MVREGAFAQVNEYGRAHRARDPVDGRSQWWHVRHRAM